MELYSCAFLWTIICEVFNTTVRIACGVITAFAIFPFSNNNLSLHTRKIVPLEKRKHLFLVLLSMLQQ